jgi:Zinc dependent phospholipase C
LLVGFWLAGPPILAGYSMLTHEEIVDLAWADQIEPLLKQHFPQATPTELNEAHAYAYGGCIIQDLGYYPFGSKDFSNLLHYVRSGDFVVALLRDADDLDGYAFALGALAHYVSDIEGHPSINRAVALSYPKLEREYGKEVTYEEDHRAHIRTEFGFDVVQVAKGRFTSDSYHNFIGFEVPKPLLEQAFRETYGLELNDVLKNPGLAIGTYRRSVSKIIPEMTRVALLTKHAELVRENPDFDQQKFLYRLSRTQYEKQWGNQYQRPGWRTRFLAFVVKILPKVGPLKSVDITLPSSKTEDLYIQSVNQTVDTYKAELALLRKSRDKFTLPNRDFDTGKPTKPSEYKLADETYAKLVESLAETKFKLVSPELQANIVAFYSSEGYRQPPDMSADEWRKVESAVGDLKGWHPGA